MNIRQLVRRRQGALFAAALAGLLLSAGPTISGETSAATNEGGHAAMRRLTEEQYRNVVTDIFGDTIELRGRLEPDNRSDHLIAIGAGKATITAAGFEQYDKIARGIGEQLVQPANRHAFLECTPASNSAPDEACTRTFLRRVGRLLFRRPLTAIELKTFADAAVGVAQQQRDFYSGISLAVAGMLSSPQFLYVQEIGEPDPDRPGQFRLDAYSRASRLSFLMWNTAPDQELLDAAEKGQLEKPKGLAKQVDRLLASPRLEAGVRAFFTDMLQFELFNTLAKDSTLYKKFTLTAAQDAREQTLRTIVQNLVQEDGDYRDLFTTRKTFLTSDLAALYRVPFPSEPSDTNGWVPYEFPQDSGQSGILTQASFVALHSHPARSSATLRGKALLEIFECVKVPDPPGNVTFTVVQDTSNPMYKTARARLTAHAKEPMCAGCHHLVDPAGLALENFDTTGQYRDKENGADIDTSGTFAGTKFDNVVGLGKILHDQPSTASCLVKRLYDYGLGRTESKSEQEWRAEYLEKAFAGSSYRFRPLLRELATSENFYRFAASPAGEALPGSQSAASK